MKTPGKNGTVKSGVGKSGVGKSTAAKAQAAKKPAGKKTDAKAAPKKEAAGKPVTKKVLAKKLVKLAPLLARIVPPAPAPASASRSDAAVLDRLFTVITDRRAADPSLSHSARLLSRGMAKVAQKFGEEAVECLIEAVEGNAEALVAESADVLYHLLVLWVAAGVEPHQVWAELTRREGVSGVVEKAARTRPAIGTTKIP